MDIIGISDKSDQSPLRNGFSRIGAAAHRLKLVWLEGGLPNGVFGLKSAIECAPLRFDTSPFDFFFWDFLEERVSTSAPDTTRELEDTYVSDLGHLG